MIMNIGIFIMVPLSISITSIKNEKRQSQLVVASVAQKYPEETKSNRDANKRNKATRWIAAWANGC